MCACVRVCVVNWSQHIRIYDFLNMLIEGILFDDPNLEVIKEK